MPCLLAMTICTGCSPAELPRYAVEGQVTLDGKPVNGASIIFTPQGAGLAAAADIVDGHFALPENVGPTAGEFSVRINPHDPELEAAQADPSLLVKAHRKPSIPKVYRSDGRLSATITSQPMEPLVFQLTSR